MISGMELDPQQELQNYDFLSEELLEMDLDEAFQEDQSQMSCLNIWISNKNISENKKATSSPQIVLSQDLLHKYYSYILYNTSKLFPTSSPPPQQKKLLMLEAPKVLSLPSHQKEPFNLIVNDSTSETSFLPIKRQSQSCSYPTKVQKLSYYNDIYSF